MFIWLLKNLICRPITTRSLDVLPLKPRFLLMKSWRIWLILYWTGRNAPYQYIRIQNLFFFQWRQEQGWLHRLPWVHCSTASCFGSSREIEFAPKTYFPEMESLPQSVKISLLSPIESFCGQSVPSLSVLLYCIHSKQVFLEYSTTMETRRSQIIS